MFLILSQEDKMRKTKRILSFLLALTVTLSSLSETIAAGAEYIAENAETSAASPEEERF